MYNEVMKILVATHNPGKLGELREGLSSLKKDFEVIALSDLGITQEPVENGQTFEENARIKAQFYANLTGLPTVSDDGGLIIEALNGEPGVHTKMWLGRIASDQELIDYTLERLKGKSNRKAYFETCLYFFNPKSRSEIVETEKIKGHISETPHSKIIPGYPYRSVFIADGLDKYYLELTPEEHDKINHRIIATKRLAEKISSHLLK